MNNFFDNQRILEVIWKRKFHFIIVGLVAIALSAVFSGSTFIKPKYKSTARIYPTNLWELSEESKTEQMLEVINSRDIKLKMFDAFGGNNYNLPTTDWLTERVISLPIHTEIENSSQDFIIEKITVRKSGR